MIFNYLDNPIKYKLDEEEEERNFISCDFDKAEVLRILAQDNCEGIRLYMAKTDSVKIHKKDNNNTFGLTKVNNSEANILTLVMVGIDKEFKDLIIRFPQEEPNKFKVFMGCSEACGHSCSCQHTTTSNNIQEEDDRHILLKLKF